MKKCAVIVFNLGGPDTIDNVQPFLFNLFNDKAIINLPDPIRWFFAKMISWRRALVAQEIYAQMGGKSPLTKLTREQATALETALNTKDKTVHHMVFVAMRYWHPLSDETVREVKNFTPDEIILLPLYPQFSTTTTGSSIRAWKKAAACIGMDVRTHVICCYPTDPGFIKAVSDRLQEMIVHVRDSLNNAKIRILFSAHGLPKKIIEGGDPYQWQIERSVNACIDELSLRNIGEFDHVICYQSRVGPMQWIGPSTKDEIRRAALDGMVVVVVPIAFVSEHSETKVELDIEYRHFAEKLGISAYYRVDTVGTHPHFIAGLCDLVLGGTRCTKEICGGAEDGSRLCPSSLTRCLLNSS